MPDELTLFAMASDLEKLVYAYLATHNIPFDFQSNVLGEGFGQQIGDAKVDFILPDNRIAIRVQGEYWHKQPATEAKDIIQRERLIAMGWKVVDIWTNDIKNNLEETMRKALIGEEMPN